MPPYPPAAMKFHAPNRERQGASKKQRTHDRALALPYEILLSSRLPRKHPKEGSMVVWICWIVDIALRPHLLIRNCEPARLHNLEDLLSAETAEEHLCTEKQGIDAFFGVRRVRE